MDSALQQRRFMILSHGDGVKLVTDDHMPDDFGYFGEELLLQDDLDNKMWTTRDHRNVHVSDMTTPHIFNCITLIESGRHPNITHVLGLQYIAMFDNELKRRSQKRLEENNNDIS